MFPPKCSALLPLPSLSVSKGQIFLFIIVLSSFLPSPNLHETMSADQPHSLVFQKQDKVDKGKPAKKQMISNLFYFILFFKLVNLF